MVIVDTGTAVSAAELDRAVENLRAATAITVAIAERAEPVRPVAEVADIAIAGGHAPLGPAREPVWVTDPLAAVAGLRARVAASPVAAVSLTWLLRGSSGLEVPAALAEESATYSTLLAGAEFRRWLAARGEPRPPDEPERVRLSREGGMLSITLSRVRRRNAVDSRMRDALREALAIAQLDTSLAVEITGNGPTFSAGGDLDEFGSAADPAIAHLVRVEASAGALLNQIRDRVTVRLHGTCVGAGIEIPAFAGRLTAAPGSLFALPEIGMGLIPGAGGTVSITRRIGRHRMLWMALTGAQVDITTALAWGLIDAVG
jgi:hypothetical protein